MRNHRPFTKKQTSELLSNPYVASVTPCQIYYELCPQKWTFGHTKTDTYRFKEQFHRFETVMPETRYVDDVSH